MCRAASSPSRCPTLVGWGTFSQRDREVEASAPPASDGRPPQVQLIRDCKRALRTDGEGERDKSTVKRISSENGSTTDTEY